MPIDLLNLTLHLRVVGILLLLVAAMHAFIPRHFSWKSELAKLSAVNRQIFISHTLFIVLLLILAGLFTLCGTPLLLDRTPLACTLLAGMAALWLGKAVSQLVLFSSAKQRSSRFGIGTHLLFVCLWLYVSGVYAVAWITR